MVEAEAARAHMVEELRTRGNLAMGRNDHKAALAFYSEGLNVDGLTNAEELKLRGNRAACLLAMGQNEQAADDARAALKIDYTLAKNHVRLASALEAMGDTRGALSSFRAARCFDHDNAELTRHIEELELLVPDDQEGEGAESAEPQAERPLEVAASGAVSDVSDPHTQAPAANSGSKCEELRLRANALFKAGEVEKARKLYTRALGLVEEAYGSAPSTVAKGEATPAAQLYANRCQAALTLGDIGGALRDAGWACDAAPNWPKAHFRLGTVYLHKKQFADAYAAFKRASHLDPKNEELIEACRQARSQMLEARGVTDHFAMEHDQKLLARARAETPSSDASSAPVDASQVPSAIHTEPRHELERIPVSEDSHGALKLSVWLPNGVGMAALDLQISADMVILQASEASIALRLPLPATVVDAEAKASFSKKRGVLTVIMPLSEPVGAVLV
eukprot:scaffold149042_cov31-Tisochrysis_lutea.AAC.2